MIIVKAIGDIGVYDPDVRKLVNKLNNGQEFIAILGDNFYPYGLQNDAQVKAYLETFAKVKTPIYPILGNHDYSNADVRMQIKFPYWSMPHYYYCKIYDNIGFWFIDTQLLDPGDKRDNNVFMNLWRSLEMVHGDVERAAEYQLQWLTNSLQRHKKLKFKVVFGHYPIFTGGIHGDNIKLVQKLLPLFKKFNVTTYISGHDHNLQHIQRNANGYNFHQYISGCSTNQCAYDKIMKKHGLQFFSSNPGYIKLRCTKKTLNISFHDIDNQTVYSNQHK